MMKSTSLLLLALLIGAVLALLNLRALVHVGRFGDNGFLSNSNITWNQIDEMLMGLPSLTSASMYSLPKKKKKTTVAYAVSVTKCVMNEDGRSTLDRAAVLHQSIKISHGHPVTLPARDGNDDRNNIQTTKTPAATTTTKSKYDFHMHAFVHLNASECAPYLQRMGYITHIRDTPVHKSEMPEKLASVQHNSCCGDLEWSKLYTYALTDYPVATHLDLDTIVLKVMDDVYDLMIDDQSYADDGKYNRSRFVDNHENAMWVRQKDELPKQVDFVFTRDYNMVNPPLKKVHQIGVQGGFLVVRPNITEFERLKELIRHADHFEAGSGWGGKDLAYGGYFGAGTIQGFASYYYSEIALNRSVEVNRCYYNTMVDSPYHVRGNRTLCRTLEPDGTCEDCRLTPISKLYTAHFTVCGKPEWCVLDHKVPLCANLFSEWHRIRSSLEQEWIESYGPNSTDSTTGVIYNMTAYDPKLEVIDYNSDKTREKNLAKARGHCKRQGGYSKLVVPDGTGQLM